jgi:hypothetical protein
VSHITVFIKIVSIPDLRTAVLRASVRYGAKRYLTPFTAM